MNKTFIHLSVAGNVLILSILIAWYMPWIFFALGFLFVTIIILGAWSVKDPSGRAKRS